MAEHSQLTAMASAENDSEADFFDELSFKEKWHNEDIADKAADADASEAAFLEHPSQEEVPIRANEAGHKIRYAWSLFKKAGDLEEELLNTDAATAVREEARDIDSKGPGEFTVGADPGLKGRMPAATAVPRGRRGTSAVVEEFVEL